MAASVFFSRSAVALQVWSNLPQQEIGSVILFLAEPDTRLLPYHPLNEPLRNVGHELDDCVPVPPPHVKPSRVGAERAIVEMVFLPLKQRHCWVAHVSCRVRFAATVVHLNLILNEGIRNSPDPVMAVVLGSAVQAVCNDSVGAHHHGPTVIDVVENLL